MTGVDRFELLLGLLTVAVVLSTVAQRIRMPPAAAFVLGGMALAVSPFAPAVELDPDLVLVLFLPPLLLGSAYTTVWRDFRASLRPILFLALGGVLFTTAVVAVVAKAVLPGLPWAACFALGAIVSPPDAVAAKAVLQSLRLPRRLMTVLEGESLINDASGLVLYRFAVAAAVSGTFSAGQAAASFVWLSMGGVGIGVGAGLLTDLVFRRMRDPFHTIVASFLIGWAAYIVAERVHVSGVLAVVACGLVIGWRQHETLSARVRTQAATVWQLVIFVLEALVFVLIGLSLRGVLDRMGAADATLSLGLPFALAVTAAVIVSRFALVFPSIYLVWLLAHRRDAPPGLAVPTLISWAGMRGVVSLAPALALPEGFPGRDPILLATFGVILATVLLQGMTIGPLARRLGVGAAAEAETTLSSEAARAEILEATAAWLDALRDPETGEAAHPWLLEHYRGRARVTARLLSEPDVALPKRTEHFRTALGALAEGRRALLALHRQGRIHDSVLHAVEAELDMEELHLRQAGGLEGVGGVHG